MMITILKLELFFEIKSLCYLKKIVREVNFTMYTFKLKFFSLTIGLLQNRLIALMNQALKISEKIKSVVQAILLYKDREANYPDTYSEELHFQSRKIVVVGATICIFVWIPYISVDKILVPVQPLIPIFRVGLSIASILALVAHFTLFKDKPMFSLVLLAVYLELGVGAITGLSGASPNYMGGYFFCLMILLLAPFPFFVSFIILVLSLVSFGISLYSTGTKVSELSLAYQYSMQDLIVTSLVLSIFLQVLHKMRYRSWVKSKKIEKQREEIKKDKEKIDLLLRNILPNEIAQELKETGEVKPVYYPFTTVVFTDFVDFTKISEVIPPEELLQKLDFFFSGFDKIIANHKLEKLKTIGDSYMFAGGIPVKNYTNAFDACLACLKINRFILENSEQKGSKFPWSIRIGVNSGPIMAGVIGKKKFVYDIWGDTVNTASRMESSGSQGKINISESTNRIVSKYFQTEYRGKIQAKNKGELNMYYLLRLKPEFATDADGTEPNEVFFNTTLIEPLQILSDTE
jgi:class 3 adenylate cyclase